MKRSIVLMTAFLLVSPGAFGEGLQCPQDQKILDCVTDLRDAAMKSLGNAKAKEKIEDSKQEKTTSGADPFASRLASTLTNFLDVFAGAFEVDSLSEDGRTLTLNWAPSQLEKEPFRVQSVVRKPEVFDKLKEAIPEASRDDRVAKLEKGLHDFDDVEFVATYRLNSKDSRYVPYYQEAFEEIVDLGMKKLGAAAQSFDQVQQVMQSEILPSFSELEDDDVTLEHARGVLSEERYRDLEQKIRTAATAQGAWAETVSDDVTELFEPFAKAVNNRSQWLATGSYRLRDDAVGPESWKASLRYEYGLLGNPAKIKTILESCGDDPAKCKEKIDDWNRRAGKHRLVFTADYEEVKDYRDPLSDVELHLDGTHSLVVTAAYGLYLDQAAKKRRLDLSFSYEDVSSDPERKDRMVASLAVTNLISKNLSIPIGIVYANHEKFLGDVDKQWSAHFGLNYSFDFAKN
jgi:hypothetical protein